MFFGGFARSSLRASPRARHARNPTKTESKRTCALAHDMRKTVETRSDSRANRHRRTEHAGTALRERLGVAPRGSGRVLERPGNVPGASWGVPERPNGVPMRPRRVPGASAARPGSAPRRAQALQGRPGASRERFGVRFRGPIGTFRIDFRTVLSHACVAQFHPGIDGVIARLTTCRRAYDGASLL